jgi:hypothetical protein
LKSRIGGGSSFRSGKGFTKIGIFDGSGFLKIGMGGGDSLKNGIFGESVFLKIE